MHWALSRIHHPFLPQHSGSVNDAHPQRLSLEFDRPYIV